MDFDETPEEAAFRDQVKAFLRAHVPALKSNERDQNSIFITDHDKEQAHVQRCRDWQRVKFDETGQNTFADPVLLQWTGDKFVTIYPAQAAVGEAKFPMAKG